MAARDGLKFETGALMTLYAASNYVCNNTYFKEFGSTKKEAETNKCRKSRRQK